MITSHQLTQFTVCPIPGWITGAIVPVDKIIAGSVIGTWTAFTFIDF